MNYKRITKYIFILAITVLFIQASCKRVFSQDTLILAVHPYLPYFEIEKKFSPLAEYLSKEIDKTVVVRIGKNYQDHIKIIGNNQVDIAYMGPANYVHMVQQFGKKPILAGIEVNGNPWFYGKIITRSDSPLKEISDLGNGDFAFVDPMSTMGYIVPLYVIAYQNNNKKILNRYKFLGSHDNVAIGVLADDFEAGAVKDEVYNKYKDSGLKILANTPPMPEHLFVTRSNLSPLLIDKLHKALCNLGNSEEGKLILKSIKPGITGMSNVTDSDFNLLRDILKKLNENGVNK